MTVPLQRELRFDGRTYEPARDQARLAAQHHRVLLLMADGQWRTLREIEDATGDPQASISARLRDFRKIDKGGHTVNRRRRGDGGLFEYQVVERS